MKVGILAEKGAETFIWSETKRTLENAGVDIIYLEEIPEQRYQLSLRDIPARVLWKLVRWSERTDYDPVFFYPGNAVPVPCSFSGHFKNFSPATLEALRAIDLGLIIRLGGRGIYKGDILRIAKHGIISIHHGDNRKYRGGPPGFWEVCNNEPVTGFIVQRLTRTLDGGDVLARGELQMASNATRNLKQIYCAADKALSRVLAEFFENGDLAICGSSVPQLGKIYKMPGVFQLLNYMARGLHSNTPAGRDLIRNSQPAERGEANENHC